MTGGADRNGDGYADLIVGAPGFGTLSGGGAFAFFGSENGLSSGLGSARALDAAWRVEGRETDAGLGNSVASTLGGGTFLLGAPGASVPPGAAAGDGGGAAAGGDAGAAFLYADGGGAGPAGCSTSIDSVTPMSPVECTGADITFELSASTSGCPSESNFSWSSEDCNADGSGSEQSVTLQTLDTECDSSCVVFVSGSCEMGCGSDSVTLAIEDTMAPTINCPADVTVDCFAPTDPGATGDATADDDCDSSPTVEFTDSEVPTCGSISRVITRTWAARDSCGNASEPCVQTITVEDREPPEISCSDEFVECGADTSPGALPLPFATDACSEPVTLTSTDTSVPGCGDTEVITRTWTATDACSNQATCVQTIIVEDREPPSIFCPPNVEIECGGDTSPATTGMATATDNCGEVTVTSEDDIQPGGCGNSLTIARRWIATDACGNTNPDDCVQLIDVVDRTPPSITCPEDATVECGEDTSPASTGMATATDDCSGTLTPQFSDSFAPDCGDTGVITRTWTVQDDCSNSAQCVQTITIVDTTPPEITSCPDDVTIGCEARGGGPAVGGGASVSSPYGLPTVTDTCGFAFVEGFVDDVAPGCGLTEVITRTFTVRDACGNTETCDQTITVAAEPPSITCPDDVTVACGADTSPAATGVAQGSDSCGDVTVGSDDGEPFDCPGSFVRTWTVTNACGLTSTCQQTINVSAPPPPVITCPDDRTVEANVPGCGYEGDIGNATATGCGDIGITHDAVFPLLFGDNTITWTATGPCAATACPQTITVVDTTPPEALCQDITVFLNVNGSKTITPDEVDGGSNDLCGIGSVELDTTRFDCDDLGENTVVLTVTDNNGNVATCEATVTVRDTRDPTITCPADTVRVANSGCVWVPESGGGASTLGTPSADDNCPGVELSNNAPPTFPLGVTVVQWTATDTSGNTATCDQLVTVVDETPPTVNCPADTVREANSNCGWTPEDGGGASALGSPSATDNCSSAGEITLSRNGPATFPLGTTTVVWTAEDAAGNKATCTQLVRVIDTTPPTLVCPPDTVRLANASCRYVPEDGGGASRLGSPTVDDNCTGSVTVTNDAPGSFGLGTTEVKWTATDAAGNSSSCTQLVTVVDGTAPVIACPPSISRNANLGSFYFPSAEEILATASDNCSAVTLTSDAPKGFPLGMTVVTYSAVDEAGNASSCTQTVTVVDSAAPELTCPEALIVEPNAGCTWVGDFGIPAVTDADSDEADITLTNDAPGAFPLGTTIVMWTATDLAGNSSSCMQEVTVVDLTAPTLFCPAGPLTAVCTDAAGATVEFETSATDNCGDDAVTLVCEPPSGSVFPPGLTTVTCTATDASGNTATCSFDVDVACGGLVLPGDCNFDGQIDLSDAVCSLLILFTNTPILPPCGSRTIRDPANVTLLSWNGTGDVDLASAVALLNWKFLGGPPHVLGTGCTPIDGCEDVCGLGSAASIGD